MGKLAVRGGEPEIKKLPTFFHPKVSDTVIAKMQDPNFRDQMASYDGAGVFHVLEDAFRTRFGLAYALSTNSGTSALFSMFYAAGLREGDEVLVPAYTFYATATPLLPLRCELVLVDCTENGNIDPVDIRRKITRRTRAIVITHMWGIPCDMSEIVQIAQERGIILLEDASHGHGATYRDRALGTFGQGAAWSLGAKKIVTGGQGGMYGTSDRTAYERAMLLGHSNSRADREISIAEFRQYRITGLGFNLRMHPFSAVLIHDQLEKFDQTVGEKREVAAYLSREVAGVPGLSLPRVPDQAVPSWYAFPMIFDPAAFEGVTREAFVGALAAEGALEFDIPRSTCPLTDFAIFRNGRPGLAEPVNVSSHRYSEKEFSGAESFHGKILKLPVWYGPDRMEYALAYVRALHKVIEHLDELRVPTDAVAV